MGRVPATMTDAQAAGPRLWGGLAVGFLAFTAYVLCATPAPYALDSAEVATAAFGLGNPTCRSRRVAGPWA